MIVISIVVSVLATLGLVLGVLYLGIHDPSVPHWCMRPPKPILLSPTADAADGSERLSFKMQVPVVGQRV